MRGSTGFPSNRRPGFESLAEGFQPLTARECSLPLNTIVTINAMDVKSRYCNIDTSSFDVHRGRVLSSRMAGLHLPFWRIDADRWSEEESTPLLTAWRLSWAEPVSPPQCSAQNVALM